MGLALGSKTSQRPQLVTIVRCKDRDQLAGSVPCCKFIGGRTHDGDSHLSVKLEKTAKAALLMSPSWVRSVARMQPCLERNELLLVGWCFALSIEAWGE
jgi:hypothetical protein